MQSGKEFAFFKSQYKRYDPPKIISTKEGERRNMVEHVWNNTWECDCILKIYYDNDLSGIYRDLKKICKENPSEYLTVVYDACYYDNDTYVLEEAIAGETLEEILAQKGTLSEKEVAEIIIKLCDGLSLLHNQNPPIIHKDIKPSNIIVKKDGGIKLIDFDISRKYHENKNQDSDTMLLGTRGYLSPEHFMGLGQTAPASDIFSIGITMYKMLTQKQYIDNIEYEGELRSILDKCLDWNKHQRYQNAGELKYALNSYLDSKKRSNNKKNIHNKDTSKHKILSIICVTLGVLLLLLISITFLGNISEKNLNESRDIVENNSHNNLKNNNAGVATQDANKVDAESEGKTENGNSIQDYRQIEIIEQLSNDDDILAIGRAKGENFYYVKNISGDGFYLVDSKGNEVFLEEDTDMYRAYGLLYDPYSEITYLLHSRHSKDLSIMKIETDLSLVNMFESNGEYYCDCGGQQSLILEDGTMICGNIFIDTNTWAVKGETQFNGHFFVLGNEFYQMSQENGINQIDLQGNIIKTYDNEGEFGTGERGHQSSYCVYDDAIYFITDSVLYMFSEETIEPYLTLSDYLFWDDMISANYKCLLVSDNSVVFYDFYNNCVKQIKLV